MSGRQNTRISIVEYGSPCALARDLSAATGLSVSHCRNLLQNAGDRLTQALGLSRSPILVDSQGTRVVDIAGIVRLSPSVELEIIPKFLASSQDYTSWREDFFFLSTLSKYGELFVHDKISSTSGSSANLATLIARSFVSMYFDNRRRPVRTYRRSIEEDFFIEGEVDPFDLYNPSANGFKQEIIRYDRVNRINGLIAGAAKVLLTEVTDPVVVSGLIRVLEDMPRQGAPVPEKVTSVPQRSSAWKPIVELSKDVLRGLGLSYRLGSVNAPGYVVQTWQTWETTLTLALRYAYAAGKVISQEEFGLGKRLRPQSAGCSSSNLKVKPDVIIENGQNGSGFIVDAKYKTENSKGRLSISGQDIYEAMAFAKATSLKDIVLIYPATGIKQVYPLGEAQLFEKVQVPDCSIYGVQAEIRGISLKGGIRQFAVSLKSSIDNILVNS